jgi:glycerol kinase
LNTMVEIHNDVLLSIDAGTTGIRAMLFSKSGEVLLREYEKITTMRPEPGAVEHDPEQLWSAFKLVCSRIFERGYSEKQIRAMGISVQRSTFCLFDRSTKEVLTPFLSWADVRSRAVARKMNRNPLWLLLRSASWILRILTRNPLFVTTTMLKFVTDYGFPRLLWLFEQNPELKLRAKKGELGYLTLDSFFLWKLSNHSIHRTDPSNASSTSFYNPFHQMWNGIYLWTFGVPKSLFPEILDTASNFGETDPQMFFGQKIPVTALIGDQMSALFGHGCTEAGEVKISQGSGSFVDVNVGPKGKVSSKGLFPLIAWRTSEGSRYLLEGSIATAGTLIDWLGRGIGISENPQMLEDLASQCEDPGDVVFLPIPSGIRFPFFNPYAKAAVLGLSLQTSKRHFARAVLEGIAHRIEDILDGIESDTGVRIKAIRADGGVSNSNVLMQAMANFSDIEVERSEMHDMTALGAALLAGLGAGVYESIADIKDQVHACEYQRFSPQMQESERKRRRGLWKAALKSVLKFHNTIGS